MAQSVELDDVLRGSRIQTFKACQTLLDLARRDPSSPDGKRQQYLGRCPRQLGSFRKHQYHIQLILDQGLFDDIDRHIAKICQRNYGLSNLLFSTNDRTAASLSSPKLKLQLNRRPHLLIIRRVGVDGGPDIVGDCRDGMIYLASDVRPLPGISFTLPIVSSSCRNRWCNFG